MHDRYPKWLENRQVIYTSEDAAPCLEELFRDML